MGKMHGSLNFKAGHGPTIFFIANSSSNFEIFLINKTHVLSIVRIHEGDINCTKFLETMNIFEISFLLGSWCTTIKIDTSIEEDQISLKNFDGAVGYSEKGELSCCETADDGPAALEELADLIWLHFC